MLAEQPKAILIKSVKNLRVNTVLRTYSKGVFYLRKGASFGFNLTSKSRWGMLDWAIY